MKNSSEVYGYGEFYSTKETRARFPNTFPILKIPKIISTCCFCGLRNKQLSQESLGIGKLSRFTGTCFGNLHQRFISPPIMFLVTILVYFVVWFVSLFAHAYIFG